MNSVRRAEELAVVARNRVVREDDVVVARFADPGVAAEDDALALVVAREDDRLEPELASRAPADGAGLDRDVAPRVARGAARRLAGAVRFVGVAHFVSLVPAGCVPVPVPVPAAAASAVTDSETSIDVVPPSRVTRFWTLTIACEAFRISISTT